MGVKSALAPFVRQAGLCSQQLTVVTRDALVPTAAYAVSRNNLRTVS